MSSLDYATRGYKSHENVSTWHSRIQQNSDSFTLLSSRVIGQNVEKDRYETLSDNKTVRSAIHMFLVELAVVSYHTKYVVLVI